MTAFARLLASLLLATTAFAAVTNVVPPASQGSWNPPNALDTTASVTDADTIAATVNIVDQKSGATGEPDQPVPETVITAVDGQLTAAGMSGGSDSSSDSSDASSTGSTDNTSTRRRSTDHQLTRRDINDYVQVFAGTGTGPNDRDASIQGTAYLTFTLVSNATYNVNDCLNFCSSVQGCVFANLYYEFNNPGLDSEFSNLKCAVYADTHTAAEKTNFGGQQLAPPPAGLTFVQQSGGWSAKTLVDPTPPEGYELVFGPTNGANNAPGYMGFAFLDRYDVDACAHECNTRGADGNGGACQYFNIWRAVVNGNPTTYTCSMYFLVADQSTAVNTGQGDLQVTFSRGYRRKNALVDGGFEGYNACSDFCFTTSYSNWVGTGPGSFDATIFHFSSYAHSGNGVGLLGSATGADNLSGTLTPTQPLQTTPGATYQISFFHASAFSGPTLEAAAFVDIMWNGQIIQTIRPGFENWKLYQFQATAVGNDVLSFHGGTAPAWSFIDDITVFQL